jgi:chemotaxis response regulator CheB
MAYKVMIVDDSVMMRNVIRNLVTKWANFEVVAHSS